MRPPMPPRLLPSLLAVTLAAACGGPGSDSPPPPPATTCPVADPIPAPTFSGDVLPKILRSSCGAESVYSCHGGTSPPGHVSWDPARTAAEVRADLVDAEPANAPPGAGWMRIAPYDVPHSWLVEKVTQDDPGGGYGARMPYSLPNLCDPTVQTIVNWIESGAPLE
jgi:hypothetical protein